MLNPLDVPLDVADLVGPDEVRKLRPMIVVGVSEAQTADEIVIPEPVRNNGVLGGVPDAVEDQRDLVAHHGLGQVEVPSFVSA